MDSVRKAQNNSAIFQHMSTNNHRIGWDQSELIYKSTCEYKRKIIEAALIKQMDNYNISEGQWKTDLVDAILIIHKENNIDEWYFIHFKTKHVYLHVLLWGTVT